MSALSVPVYRLDEDPVDHPNADRLSLLKIFGFTAIAAKREDGSHRYSKGDSVVYVPEGAIVPEFLLRQGFWDETKNAGILAGKNGDRVKSIRLRGIFSQGILFPVLRDYPDGEINGVGYLVNERGDERVVVPGDDVADFLGITKYEPPVPVAMAGEVTSLFGVPFKFDFESIQRLPDLFEDGEEVEVSEKIHGTQLQVGYIPGLNHPEMFGVSQSLYVASKGLGGQGLVFKNNEANAGNLYVRALVAMLDKGLEAKLVETGRTVRIFGEIFGKGVQDLHYGQSKPTVEIFDVQVDGVFLAPGEVEEWARRIGVPKVPVLYTGPYSLARMTELRDGTDSSGSHMREGIVIRGSGDHPIHGRKIGKFVSPDYLLRKGNVTEFQ